MQKGKMMCEVNCINCRVSAFKHGLCPDDFCEKHKALGTEDDFIRTLQPEPQWTPVSERFPDKDGWYICSIKDERVNSLYWDNRRARWVDNVRIHMFDLYTIRSKLTNEEIRMEQEAVYWDGWVTAWMPLPEPWEEGGQE